MSKTDWLVITFNEWYLPRYIIVDQRSEDIIPGRTLFELSSWITLKLLMVSGMLNVGRLILCAQTLFFAFSMKFSTHKIPSLSFSSQQTRAFQGKYVRYFKCSLEVFIHNIPISTNITHWIVGKIAHFSSSILLRDPIIFIMQKIPFISN